MRAILSLIRAYDREFGPGAALRESVLVPLNACAFLAVLVLIGVMFDA